MFDDILIQTVQQENPPQAEPFLRLPFPEAAQIFRIKNLEIESDLPIRVIDCRSIDQFHFIEAAINDGFQFRAVTDGNRREVEIKDPAEGSSWRSLTDKFISGVPSEKFPILMNKYLTERSDAIALEVARQLIKTEPYAPIQILNMKSNESIPSIATLPEEIASARQDAPFSVLKRAQRLGIEISADIAPEFLQTGAGKYSLSIRRDGRLLPIGESISLDTTSLKDRDSALAQAVGIHLNAPPLIMSFESHPERKPVVLDASHYESICRHANREGAHLFKLRTAEVEFDTKGNREFYADVTFLVGSPERSETFLLPYANDKQFERHLISTFEYYFSLASDRPAPVKMLCGREEAPYYVFEQLEPDLHSLLKELSTLGYALIDNGGGRYTLKNCTTIFEIEDPRELKTRVGELEKTFHCASSFEDRGVMLRRLIEEYVKADKATADSQKSPRSSELLTRRNILNTHKEIVLKDDLFKALQQGAALRLNFSSASEGQNRLGLYYHYAEAFSQVLMKYRRDGDPTAEEIRKLQLPAFDSVVELYCSQIPSKEAANKTPEYFKIVFADRSVDEEHILIKLGMAATRLALEERERAQHRVIISPNCKILMLNSPGRMFDPLALQRRISILDIDLVTKDKFKERLTQLRPLINPNEMIIAPNWMKEKSANLLLQDFISRSPGETSVLYLFGHSSTSMFQMTFGDLSHVGTRFLENLVTAAVARQDPKADIDLSHLTIICDGCLAGSFATHAYSHIAQVARKLERKIAKEGMPVVVGTTRDKSLNWVNFVREGKNLVAESSFIGALTEARLSSQGITIGSFLRAADNLKVDLNDKMNRWEYYQTNHDGHPVRRPLHAQVPIIPGSTIWSVEEIIQRLEDASKRTAHPLPPLPKPSGSKPGLLSLPRPIRLSLLFEREEAAVVPS